MSITANDGVSIVLPVHDLGPKLGEVVTAWAGTLRKMKTDFEILCVLDGTTEADLAAEDKAAATEPNLKLLKHESKRGIGAVLRTALPECRFDLVAHVVPNYPYTAGDLAVFLDRIQNKDERLGMAPALVAGCRTGRPVPAFWKALGVVYRGFLRVALGIPSEPLPGWLGFGEHLRAWRVWFVYGVPFQDPNCGMRLYRKDALTRFPIQSDGDFVHVELAAKCTFVTSILDEVLLTGKPDPLPASDWSDAGQVFRNPQFFDPTLKPAAVADVEAAAV